jgi:mono/diheme cytochrome c family protein
MRNRRHPWAGLAAALAVAAAGCDLGLPAGRSPHREGNRLDMVDQPKAKPQRGDVFGRRDGLLEPPAGAVAIDETPYPYLQSQAAEAGAALVNPLPDAPQVVAHGRFVYENVCITCHGARGAGDGFVTALFPKPPSLMTQKVRDWPDGELFHRPMRGQGSMPSHARQVDARDVWSVVHYIRRLQSEEPVAPPPAAAPASPAPPSADGAARPAPSVPGGPS